MAFRVKVNSGNYKKGYCLLFVVALCLPLRAEWMEPPWERHVIDDTSRGADGARLLDVNGDGLQDITTGWEEGAVTRAYINPGARMVTSPWPSVTVGATKSVEDAVFCDLDGDGSVDVVSSCEGQTKQINVHWAPADRARYLDARAWKTEAIPVTIGLTRWMFVMPMQVDGHHGTDLVVGSKDDNGLIGWLQAPANPRDLASWKFHKLYEADWIMSLVASDMDSDGDLDVLATDRKGLNRGVLWLENPGVDKVAGPWPEHRIGGSGAGEVMFLHLADLNLDGKDDITVSLKPDEVHWFESPDNPTSEWIHHTFKVPSPERVGFAKGVRIGDVNGDGQPDVVYSCESADPPKRGVFWMKHTGDPKGTRWSMHDISGPTGIKFDRIELLDLDADGDLDVITCEERHNGGGLGLVWYENPFDTGLNIEQKDM